MTIFQKELRQSRLSLLVWSLLLASMLEPGGIAFGLSAFLRRNNYGLGIGIGAGAYCLNLFSDLVEEL